MTRHNVMSTKHKHLAAVQTTSARSAQRPTCFSNKYNATNTEKEILRMQQ